MSALPRSPRSTLPACALVCVAATLLLAAFPALAQADDAVVDRVLLLPLTAKSNVRGKKLLSEAQQAIDDAAQAALGDRLVQEQRARSARCVQSATCVGKLAARADASFGVAVLLDKTSKSEIEVSLLVARADGEIEAERKVTVDRDAVAATLTSLIAELFSTKSRAGVLRALSVDERAYLVVDSVPISAAQLQAGLRLTQGGHTLSVLYAGRDPEVHTVDIPAEGEVVVELAPAPPRPKQMIAKSRPYWPAIVLGSAGAATLPLVAIYILDLALSYSAASRLGDEVLGQVDDGGPNAPHMAAAARQPQVQAARQAVATDAIIIAVLTAGAGVLLVGAASSATAAFVGSGLVEAVE